MEMTHAIRKIFASLASAKGRREHGLFMVQGSKCVLDTLGHFEIEALLANSVWTSEHESLHPAVVHQSDLERISTLQSPPPVIAMYRIPDTACSIDDMVAKARTELTLALDCIQDPGNLGTIMRVADWMGVRQIFASPDTADVWNPKAVQATMGAIARVKVTYTHLPLLLAEMHGVPVYGTFLNGSNIYRSHLSHHGVIVMGNEGNGISPDVAETVTHRITIPSYPTGSPTSESLNVAIATAITLSEFRRNG